MTTEPSEREEAPERTIDKLHRETEIPMWALEIAFELSACGMLDEETMAGMRVIPDAARVIAENSNDAATRMRERCVSAIKAALADARRSWPASRATTEYELGARGAFTAALSAIESLTLDGKKEQ